MAIGISLLAGLVRGFSGFGSALIYIPPISAVDGPPVAAPIFVTADIVTGLTFLAMTWRKAHWPDVVPMAVAAIAAFVAPMTILGMTVGAWLFHFANEKTYRRTGYAVALSSAFIGMPLFDWLLR